MDWDIKRIVENVAKFQFKLNGMQMASNVVKEVFQSVDLNIEKRSPITSR